ncbi:MAG: molybdopterin-dependent oxidoreductase [Desulfobacter sp.]|nr:molybdopterin-dependent oxidoreductase [Desulfobacter sp.]
MGEWKTTGCVLCAQNCGLKVYVDEDKITRVKPDRDNPRSKGYACRKGLNLVYHQYPADRITSPLKKVDGRFVPISWDQAFEEISLKMKSIVGEFSPRSLAYMGGSSQGGHMEAGFGLSLLRGMGSQYYYSSAGQEFSGHWWVTGRVMGKQYNISGPDEKNTQMLVAWGWNGMESHQMPRAPKVLSAIAKDPLKVLVSIDPRKSETASIADIHIALKPGTDALLIKSMICLILEKKGENQAFLETCVKGWDKVAPWFKGFDVKKALEVCCLNYDQVEALCRLMITQKWSYHQDLGIYMGRHSTLNSYLLYILGAVCGRFQTPGGNYIPGMVMPMGFHADERSSKVWKTLVTRMPPAVAGAFPPAVMPEEIMSDHPRRLRAVYVSACNPLRAYPDTSAYEKAFARLDLLVVNDIVMSETARLAHYVLPCRSFYESWDTTFFPWTYPEIYLQLRSPVVPVPGQCLEASQIHTGLAHALGLLPKILPSLIKAAKKDRTAFAGALMTWAAKEPRALKTMPFILAKTLGKEWDSAAKAGLWGMLMTAPEQFKAHGARAGFEPDIFQGDQIFEALVNSPQGLWVGRADTDNPMGQIKTPSGKLEIYIPELADQARDLNPEDEAVDLKMPKEFPLVLNAGRHSKYTMNTLMRNPEWNKGKRDCTIAVSVEDAEALGLEDGCDARITTAAGSEQGQIQVTDQVARGMVLIPHGFGLNYQGKVHGINVNRLTLNTHRDPIGTPIHRFVPCRVDPLE